MENFFKWIGKEIPDEEVIIWFNVHNMNYEKIELYGDIFKTLSYLIQDTYLGEENHETKISLSVEDKELHFEWCWAKMIENFAKEKIFIESDGEHKKYLKNFFGETFYNQQDKNIKDEVFVFVDQVFEVNKKFSKADLDILTEIYKLMEKNVK